MLLSWHCGIFARMWEILVKPFLKKHRHHFMLWHSGRDHAQFEVKLCYLVAL